MNQQPPSTVDLIMLGLLFERPMSAYALARLIEERHANKLVKISTPAVYKSCKRLFAEGFLSGRITKGSEQPEKTVYTLSKKGKERFIFLMTYFSSRLEPFFLDFNVFLYHIEKLNKKDGLQMLENLHEELSKLKAWIIQHEKEDCAKFSFATKAIVKQYRMVITTLVAWCDETLRDYKVIKK